MNSRAGLSLAEVLLALFLASVIALGVLSGLLPVLALDFADQSRGRALELAESVMETAVLRASSVEGFGELEDRPLDFVGDRQLFVYTLDVEEPRPGVRKITVKIFYAKRQTDPAVEPSRGAAGKILQLATVVHEP